jgi:hypothetical protein
MYIDITVKSYLCSCYRVSSMRTKLERAQLISEFIPYCNMIWSIERPSLCLSRLDLSFALCWYSPTRSFANVVRLTLLCVIPIGLLGDVWYDKLKM